MSTKFYFAFCTVSFLFSIAYSQSDTIIKGILQDSVTKEPLPYAHVSIRSIEDPDSIIAGVSSSETGNFELLIKGSLPAELIIRFSSIGYQDKDVIGGALSNAVLTILMKKESINIQEVLVYSYRENLKNEVDRITYFVKDDPTMQDKSGLDAAAKLPFIWRTPQNQLEYQNQQKIVVLLNGKHYDSFQNNLSVALQSIPANLIEKIELLADPGLQYRNQYTAAINIIAKGYLHGFTTSINADTKYWDNKIVPNHGAFIYWQKYNLGIQANFMQIYNYEKDAIVYSALYTDNDGKENILQTADFVRVAKSPGFNMDLSLDLEMNKEWSLNGYVAYGKINLQTQGNGIFLTQELSNESSFSNYSNTRERRPILETGVSIAKSYANQGQLNFSWRQKNSNPEMVVELLQNTGNINSSFKTQNTGLEKDLATELYYSTPVSKRITLENSIAYIQRNFDNVFLFDSLEFSSKRWKNVSSQNQSLQYQQDIIKGFQGFKYRTKTITLNAALNFDFSQYRASSEENIKSHFNFYPNIRFRAKDTKVKDLVYIVKYTRTIRRPDGYIVGAFQNIEDPLTYFAGNAKLTQQSIHSTSLGVEGITGKNKISYFTNIDFSFNPNLMSKMTKYDPELARSISSYVNQGTSMRFAWIFGLNTQLGENSSFRLQNTLSRYQFNNKISAEHYAGYNNQLNLSLNSTIFKNYNLSSDFSWFSNSPSIQGSTLTPMRYFLALSRELWQSRGGIILSLENFATTRQKYESNIEEPNYHRIEQTYSLGRNISLHFNFRFGNLKVGEPKLSKRLPNDDLQGAN